jgi:phosphonate transport system substrate-binding protein
MMSTRRKTIGRHAGCLTIAIAAIALVAAAPASADWRDDIGTLRIGIISPSGGRAIAGLGELTTAFERASGVPAEILVARDYPALIRAMAANRVHYAIYSAAAYAAAEIYCGCVEPVAAPRGVDGAIGLRALMIARRGQFEGVEGIAGARIVAGPAEDVGPQLLAVAAVRDAISAGRPESVLRAASHSEAERVFLAGEADVLVGWEPVYDADGVEPENGTLARLAEAGLERGDVETIWLSEPVTYGPHAVRADLPAELKERLGRFLVNLHDQQPDIYQLLEPYRGGGFARADTAGYASARKIANGFASR